MKHDDSVSYWQRTSQAIALSTMLPRTVDVAVIGGGLLGVATCYWLSRAGMHVALLERYVPASGATGRNGGFVRAGAALSYSDVITHSGRDVASAIMKLTTQSKVLMRQVIEEEDIACDYREPGSLRLALNEQQVEAARQEADSATALPVTGTTPCSPTLGGNAGVHHRYASHCRPCASASPCLLRRWIFRSWHALRNALWATAGGGRDERHHPG